MKVFAGVKPDNDVKAARMVSIAAASVLIAGAGLTQGLAQNERTGVSRPAPVVITASPDAEDAAGAGATQRAKPSATVPAAAPETVYGPYVPYRAPGASGQRATAASVGESAAFDPDASIVTEATAGRSERRLLSRPGDAASEATPDAGIVTYVPSLPGEISEGALVKARLGEKLSTLTTRPGSRFTAEVSDPVMHDGRVIVPVGSLLEGRVTMVRGGRRVSGGAAIHLEPRSVTLPDGAQYVLHARVIDTSSWDNTKVDSEGTILRRNDTKGTLGVMSLTAGGGMAAGAMVGGLPGALIGAGLGAGVSTVVWLKQDRQAELPKDLGLVFSLTEPMSIAPAASVKVEAAGGE